MPEEAKEPLRYRGFDIFPRPYELATGRWAMQVHIMRGDAVKPFSASNTFDSEEEARAHCVDFARKIIDGEVPEFTGADLP